MFEGGVGPADVCREAWIGAGFGPGGPVRRYRPGMGRYVALLRGINVGGKNPVGMADLREALSPRFGDVATYIQSGNVLFDTDEPRATLEPTVQSILEEDFGIRTVVVVLSRRQLGSIVAKAPAGFGASPDTYHSDAIFLKAPLRAGRVMRMIELREGVDEAWAGAGVVYFARLSARRTASRMGRIVGTPEYQSMTIRSWSTTLRLDELLAGRTRS